MKIKSFRLISEGVFIPFFTHNYRFFIHFFDHRDNFYIFDLWDRTKLMKYWFAGLKKFTMKMISFFFFPVSLPHKIPPFRVKKVMWTLNLTIQRSYSRFKMKFTFYYYKKEKTVYVIMYLQFVWRAISALFLLS